MPKFVIERDFPGAGDWTDEQLREGSLHSLAVLRESWGRGSSGFKAS